MPDAKSGPAGEPAREGAQKDAPAKDPIVIKKYANRRLYNTDTSAYVTLELLSEMVRKGDDFIVQDAKSGEDITRSVLTQIIFEQENRGQSLLPTAFLRRLIRFYGDSMQGFLPAYLEMSMETFSKSQEQMREQFNRTWGGRLPLPASFEETAARNMQMFEQAMRLWSAYTPPPVKPADAPPAAPPAAETETLSELKRQMEQMQRQLDQIATTRKGGPEKAGG